jgi:hypothetical protein
VTDIFPAGHDSTETHKFGVHFDRPPKILPVVPGVPSVGEARHPAPWDHVHSVQLGQIDGAVDDTVFKSTTGANDEDIVDGILAWDYTNNKLYVRSNDTWVMVGGGVASAPAGTLSLTNGYSSWLVQDHESLPGDTYDLLPFDLAEASDSFGNYFANISDEPDGVYGTPDPGWAFGWQALVDCWVQVSYTANWDPSAGEDGSYQTAILYREDGDLQYLYTGFLNYGGHDWHQWVSSANSVVIEGVYGLTHHSSIVFPVVADSVIGLGAKWNSDGSTGNDNVLYVPTINDMDRAYTLSGVVLEEIGGGGIA